ncbi:MAG TPA: C2H2-type zinc finger protein [Nitrososphaeraceae archaeon]
MSGVSTKAFTCSICGKTFDSNETLEAHKDKDHSIEPEPPSGVG